jgi:hypothetical protein
LEGVSGLRLMDRWSPNSIFSGNPNPKVFLYFFE